MPESGHPQLPHSRNEHVGCLCGFHFVCSHEREGGAQVQWGGGGACLLRGGGRKYVTVIRC